MKLTVKQLRELRAHPAHGNRVGLALAMTQTTQLEMAATTGLMQPYISDVARNRYQTITVEKARIFADYFGCAIEDLFPARLEQSEEVA